MIKLRTWFLPSVLLFAACSSDEGSPVAGNWKQVTGTNKDGATISFDGYSDKLNVHLAPNADGTHGHAHGTYIYDEATKSITVKAAVLVGSKEDTWTGSVDGTIMELGAADTKLRFEQGGKPAGH